MYWMFVIEMLLQAVTNIIIMMFVISQVHTELPPYPCPIPLVPTLSAYLQPTIKFIRNLLRN